LLWGEGERLVNKGEFHSIVEGVGVFGEPEFAAYFQRLFENEPISFDSFTSLPDFFSFITNQHPRLIIINGSHFSQLENFENFSQLKAYLDQMKIVSLVITKTVKEINQWRSLNWPNIRFYNGSIISQNLKQKVKNMMQERLFLEKPSLAIISKQAYLSTQVELILKNYGFRIHSTMPPSSKEKIMAMTSEGLDGILWDVQAWNENSQGIVSQMNEQMPHQKIPIIFVSEAPVFNKDKLKNDAVCIRHEKELISRIYQDLTVSETPEVVRLRDEQTGLYLPAIFFGLAEREMRMAAKHREEMAIIKLTIDNLGALADEYGPIFTASLVNNLGLFIKNRVRHTDLVAKGETGHALLMLNRVTPDLANLVAEKLRNQFKSIASFDGKVSFCPELRYEVICFPRDFASIEEAKQLFQTAFPGILCQPALA